MVMLLNIQSNFDKREEKTRKAAADRIFPLKVAHSACETISERTDNYAHAQRARTARTHSAHAQRALRAPPASCPLMGFLLMKAVSLIEVRL
jgi:hypothetical protein